MFNKLTQEQIREINPNILLETALMELINGGSPTFKAGAIRDALIAICLKLKEKEE